MKKDNVSKLLLMVISLVISFIIVMFYKINCEAYGQNSSYYNLEPSEILELQKIALAEAKGEGEYGMALVMQVVMNRVISNDFPNTVFEVISQENQFSPYANGSYGKAEPDESSEAAYELFLQMNESCIDMTNILFFEYKELNNTWANRNRHVVFTYNNHRFYE